MILVSFALAGPAADALRMRDAVSCDVLGPATVSLRDELLQLAEQGDGLPWVSVRAAGCLVTRFSADPSVVDHLAAWAGDSERVGLTLVVLDQAHLLAPGDALRVAKAAMTLADPRWHARFADRLQRSDLPELRAMVGVDAPEAAQ